MSRPAGPVPATVEPEVRLDSWKEIAAYLNRGVTTVQRWEREEGLPVHRHQHEALGSVFAYRHELEAWRVQRAVGTEGDEPSTAPAKIAPKPQSSSRLYQGLVLAAVFVAAGLGAISQRFAIKEPPKPVRRLTIVASSAAQLAQTGTDRNLAVTPDGSRVVYVGGAGASRLFVRAFDQLDPAPIAGVSSPRHPFVSPDGQWIGFFDGRTMKKVPMAGGPPTTVVQGGSVTSSAPSGPGDPHGLAVPGPRGASWGPDNKIAFASEGRLLSVSSNGGAVEVLMAPELGKGETAACWPEYLPDGQALLFTIVPAGDWSETGSRSSFENAQVAVLDLRTRQRKVLLEGGSHAHYVDSGHLVYSTAGTLKAVRFDRRRLAIVGTPKTVLTQVATSARGAADFDVARDGTLVYAPGSIGNDLFTLTWVDRRGREEATRIPPFVYRYPRLSPDGRRLALGSLRDLGLWDFSTETLSWFGVGPASYPTWTPDGRRLFFGSLRSGPAQLYSQVIEGAQSATRVTQGTHGQYPNAISPDGSHLVFREDAATADLMVLELTGARRVQPLVHTSFRELNAEFFPDGNFVAYQSNESGQDEVYVQPFPNAAGKRWKVSSGGGTRPMWARNGQELFYLSPTGGMMSVAIQRSGGGFATGTPTKLFEGPYYVGGAIGGRTYDVSPRDGRFLMMKYTDASNPVTSGGNIEVVLNWFEELKHTVAN